MNNSDESGATRSLAFIWDLDGTLVDSYPAMVPEVCEVLESYGLCCSEQEIHAEVIRTSVGDCLEKIAGERGLEAAELKAAFNRLNDSRVEGIRPMPHCAQTLEALRRAGHRHFVFTHRGASCRSILDHTGLTPYFSELVTSLNGFPRKPEPDGILYLMDKYGLAPDRCFYVGDRSLDMEAAERAGIGSILYLDPSSPGQPTGRETYLVRSLLEIPGLAASLTRMNESGHFQICL